MPMMFNWVPCYQVSIEARSPLFAQKKLTAIVTAWRLGPLSGKSKVSIATMPGDNSQEGVSENPETVMSTPGDLPNK